MRSIYFKYMIINKNNYAIQTEILQSFFGQKEL